MKIIVAIAIILLFSITANAQKVIIGKSFNDVGNELSLLVQDKLDMTEKESNHQDSAINIVFEPKFYTGTKRSISLHYSIKSDGTVTGLKVEGTIPEVVSVFADYWKTKANYTTSKSFAIEKHFISDVIRLKSGTPGEASLTVFAL